jgi:GNAT superfamily N-acetyltransferase
VLAAVAAGKVIVGVIAVRGGSHVSLMFVDPSVQGRGIGRRLFEAALAVIRRGAAGQRPGGSKRLGAPPPASDCTEAGFKAGTRSVTVNSSDHAVDFYRSLGFEPVRPAYFKNGMKITPMRKDLG